MKFIRHFSHILALIGIIIGNSSGSDAPSPEGIPPKHNYGSIDQSVPLNLSFTKVDGDEGKKAVSPANKKPQKPQIYHSLAPKRNNQKTNCCTLCSIIDYDKKNHKNENDYEEPWYISLCYMGALCDSSYDSGYSGWDCGGCDCDCSGFDCGD